jgi:hypothetical protein
MQTRWFILLAATLVVGPSCDDGGSDGATDGLATETSGAASAGSDTQASTSSGSSAGSASSAGVTTSDSGTSDDPLQLCVDRINEFRATEGLPPYDRWTDGEDCAATQAAADAESGVAHSHFGDCNAFAQNTCPGWPSIDAVIGDCFQQMWDEGPGEDYNAHGHYLAMSSTDYTEVACAFVEMPDGSIWANQNFR